MTIAVPEMDGALICAKQSKLIANNPFLLYNWFWILIPIWHILWLQKLHLLGKVLACTNRSPVKA